MRTLFFVLLIFTFAKCDDSSVNSSERKLDEVLVFIGEAEGEDEGVNVRCACELALDLPEYREKNGQQIFTGNMGGDMIRTVLDDEGAGFSFKPFLQGYATVTVKANDSIYISWPGNSGTGFRFYDEISLFKGVLNDDGSITGEWKCAPFDNVEDEAYVDTKGIIKVSWSLIKPEEDKE